MDNICLLFPGQGSQYVGMGQSFLELEHENSFIKDLMLNGPIEELTKTFNAQPAILLHSVLAFRYLRAKKPNLNILAGLGHSLGEYSALVCAETISLKDALELVTLRGKYMQEACPLDKGSMAAILGLDPNTIKESLLPFSNEESEDYVSIANFNGPMQTVISGTKTGVLKAIETFKSLKAKRALELNVSAPFHSSLMKPAALKLANDIEKIEFKDPIFPIISASKVKVLKKGKDIKEALFTQITDPVFFTDSVNLAINSDLALGGFLEVGPKEVLSGIVKRISENALVKNIDTKEDIEHV